MWGFVHISDVSAFYALLVRKILRKEALPSGQKAYYFLEAGETSWLNISERIARAGVKHGVFETVHLKTITSETLCEAFNISFLNPDMVEVIWGSK